MSYDETRRLEEGGFDIFHKAEVDGYAKRKNLYESNLKEAYAFIVSYCNKITQSRVESDPKYE